MECRTTVNQALVLATSQKDEVAVADIYRILLFML